MGEYVFLFDLDATVTKAEILPVLAEKVGIVEKMCDMTERTMRGEIPFKSSFLSRVEMLKDIPVSKASAIVERIPINEKIVDFIRNNQENCYIVTGNIDVWVEGLIDRIGLNKTHCFCSTARVKDDALIGVNSVLDKGVIVEQFVKPVVAIGDGSNDAEMVRLAEIGIGYGGVRPVAYSLMSNANYVVYDEKRLCAFLNHLCKDNEEADSLEK